MSYIMKIRKSHTPSQGFRRYRQTKDSFKVTYAVPGFLSRFSRLNDMDLATAGKIITVHGLSWIFRYFSVFKLYQSLFFVWNVYIIYMILIQSINKLKNYQFQQKMDFYNSNFKWPYSVKSVCQTFQVMTHEAGNFDL